VTALIRLPGLPAAGHDSPVTASRPGPPAPRLADIRSRWLAAAAARLRADQTVLGVALAGSLGAGQADDWSDIDLLVIVTDALVGEHAAPGRPAGVPGSLTFAVDARQNAPLGVRATSEQYVIDGLPLWVDRYLYPVSGAAWPSDSAVLFDRHGIGRQALTFAGHLNAAEHNQAVPNGPGEERALRAALVPVAGKYIARRSADAGRLVELAGGARAPGRPGRVSWRRCASCSTGMPGTGPRRPRASRRRGPISTSWRRHSADAPSAADLGACYWVLFRPYAGGYHARSSGLPVALCALMWTVSASGLSASRWVG
jgi:hypothetical protein